MKVTEAQSSFRASVKAAEESRVSDDALDWALENRRINAERERAAETGAHVEIAS